MMMERSEDMLEQGAGLIYSAGCALAGIRARCAYGRAFLSRDTEMIGLKLSHQ